jgi:nucleoside phosphorylase
MCDPSLVADAPGGDGFRVVRGRIATVSVCAGSERLARERGATGAVAESMEGAAVAFAATLFGLPFAEVRGISNLCGPREGARFDLATAVRNASAVLVRA